MFRIVHGLFYFPENIFFHHNNQRVTRSLNPYSFVCPFARTCYYYNSYIPRTIRLWNSYYLPHSLIILSLILYHPLRLMHGHIYIISMYCYFWCPLHSYCVCKKYYREKEKKKRKRWIYSQYLGYFALCSARLTYCFLETVWGTAWHLQSSMLAWLQYIM